jgi:uncharacterized protein
MKIEINKIPLEGEKLDEEIPASALDLETDLVKFSGPVRIKAEVFRITNAISVNLDLYAKMQMDCSRCLNAFETELKKNLKLNYQIDKNELVIDLDPQIREEIILDYPLKPLCAPDCKGLCPKCGKNLNEGKCNCVY